MRQDNENKSRKTLYNRSLLVLQKDWLNVATDFAINILPFLAWLVKSSTGSQNSSNRRSLLKSSCFQNYRKKANYTIRPVPN